MHASASSPVVVERLSWRRSPAEVIRRWPSDRPLFALSTGAAHAPPRCARWTILTTPSDQHWRLRSDGASGGGVDGLNDALLGTRRERPGAPALPFTSGWIGWMSYELGAVIEPTIGPLEPGTPLARFDWCAASLLFDHVERRWWAAGRAGAVGALVATAEPGAGRAPAGDADDWACGPLRSRTGERGYRCAVDRAVELIHAGDMFQANLAHVMEAPFRGSVRGLFLALMEGASPDHGALLEHPDASNGEPSAVASISPEFFLRADLAEAPGGRIVTRPIKGTRRAAPGAVEDLRRSAKEQAELVMIVDLMRNDLGRVRAPGSVRVESARDIERHAGGSLLHATATVSGRLRAGVAPSDIVRATFPPGSVTGAPKIRAMQVIRELERAARGVYCGAIGCFSDEGPTTLSVAIRTASIMDHSTLVYPVGAGIVAESDAEAEWRETLAKAEAIDAVIGRRRRGVRAEVGAA